METIFKATVKAFRTIPTPFDNYMINEDGTELIRKEHDVTMKCRPMKDGTRNDRVKKFKQSNVNPCLNKSTGYYQVCLIETNEKKGRHTKYIHGLVAEAFIGPRPNGCQIDHIDGNRANNHYTNLEYVTAKENIRRMWKRKLENGN